MSRSLKFTVYLLLFVFVLFFLIPVFLPSEISVSTNKEIKAPVSVVFSELNSIKKRQVWTPFKSDSATTETFTGPLEGKGATSKLQRHDTLIRELTIIKSIPDSLIEYELTFNKGQRGAVETFKITGDSLKTNVLWEMNIVNLHYPFGRWLGLVMKSSMKPVLKKGLDNLTKITVKNDSVN